MISQTEKDAMLNCMDAMRKDPQAGPVGLGSIVVLEQLLERDGYDLENPGKTTYDFYVQLCGENGVTPLPAGEFPSGLKKLADWQKAETTYPVSSRVYYSDEYDCLCQVMANAWDDGACFIANRYTDDITDSYFITERYRLREVLP
jgi:hypothetical protein